MRELSRRGVKAFAVLSFMAFTSCAIAGARCFLSFHTAPATCRTHDAAHDQGREAAPLMRHRTPRTYQRCVPAGEYADVAQSAEHPAVNRSVAGSRPAVCTIGVTFCLAAARSVSLRKWSFLCAVRKRQDEEIYILAGTGFVKMNGCDRRTGAGLKSSVGYRHCCTLRECRGVQWMWCGGGNRMIRPLCKQFKQSAMPGPVKRQTPNEGGVVALRGG